MIITDPSKRPSGRFIEVVQGNFFANGFIYKKSLNQFVRNIENRKEMVSIFYNKTVSLVRATMSWSILFPELEKVYKKINVEDWQRNAQTTLWTDLFNYRPRRNTNNPSDFDLYNSIDYKYDDISINNASSALMENYTKYVQPFFDRYMDLRTLEKELNEMPLRHHPYIGYGGRRIALGLVLAKLYQKENFEFLKNAYQEYIISDKEGEVFKQKMQKYFDGTIDFLDKNDIDKLIV